MPTSSPLAALATVLLAAVPCVAPAALAAPPPVHRSALQTLVLRLRPGDDVKAVLDALCRDESIDAGCILSAVGSLKQASIRLADQPKATVLTGPFEIVSLSGRLSRQGCHLHLAVSDASGKTVGGHLMPGNRVYTTLELVVGVLPDLVFRRETDGTTGYQELTIDPKTPASR